MDYNRLVGGDLEPIDPANVHVVHNAAQNRFEVLTDGHLSRLDYILDGDTILMTHVEVDPVLRGQGMAAAVTRVALDYARAHSLRVVPICPYVVAYMRRHPQYDDLRK